MVAPATKVIVMINLPHENDLIAMPNSVREMAEKLYPGVTYDTALPQGWVNEMQALGFDPRGQVIWLYPNGLLAGQPAPLTAEAMLELCKRV